MRTAQMQILEGWLAICKSYVGRQFLPLYFMLVLLIFIPMSIVGLPETVGVFGDNLIYTAAVPGNELHPARKVFHFVSEGENLYRISRKYFVTVKTLTRLNRINNPNIIQPGRRLEIPATVNGLAYIQRYRVKPSDTLQTLLQKHKLEKWQFLRLNPGVNPEAITVGSFIILPRPETPVTVLNKSGNLALIIPVRGFVTSRYGWRWGRMHYGLDLGAPSGAPVRAAATGRIMYAGWLGGYGLYIKVNHGQYTTCYGHLSRILVHRGILVRQGDLIGLVGSTGNSSGSHLHFEVERYGRKVNPSYYLWRY